MNDFNEILNSLPPPPSGPAPKPPRRVSTILSSPTLQLQANPSTTTDDRPAMMKKLSRVLNTRRFSKEKKELERNTAEADSSLGYHLDAFYGKIGVIQKAISRDKYVVNQYFNYSISPLLTEEEISNSHYIPPPPLPKLIKLTLKKTVPTMTLDQKWLLTYSFADSTLLHYACAGDQYEVVKFLLENGADWKMLNAVNKPADAYTIQEDIRELFVDADEKYEPLSAPPPARLSPALLALQNPTEAPSPPPAVSILKPAGSGRRRQSIVNDAQWVDNNLRSTVHQAAVLNIRGANTATNSNDSFQEPLKVGKQGSVRGGHGNSFRRPDDSAEEEEDEGPIATFVPMSFGKGSVGMMKPTSSTYSAAESVHSNLSAALDYPVLSDLDEQSVASGLTGTTMTGSVSGGATGSRMSARRRSRVVQSLRLRDSVTAATPAADSTTSVDPNTTQEIPTTSKYPARRNKSPQKISSVTSFTDQASDLPAAASKLSSPAKLKRSSSTRKMRNKAEKQDSNNNTANIDSDDIVNTKKERTRKTKDGMQLQPKRKVKPPPPRPGSVEDTTTTTISANNTTTFATTSTADLKATTMEAMPEEHTARQSAAPPPPLRVMRRLSVNTTQHSLEALSYIEGADGAKQVVESGAYKGQEDASPTKPDIPESGLERLFSRDCVAIDTEAQRKAALAMVAERESDAYLEAWECKATDQSPFERLQVSLLTGKDAEKSVQAADLLIAKAKAMEKQEAREAKKNDARAENLKQMLSKLTPLETIASGVLHGRVTNIVAGASTLDAHSAWLSETQNNEQQEMVDETGLQDSSTVRFQLEEGQQFQEQRVSTRVGPVSTPTRPLSLTYRELIWRRAGQHMNAALHDVHRNEYDRARAEAYQLGVRLLRQEFRSYAQKDRWEAVEFLEEQRMQESERHILASDKILLSMGVGLDSSTRGSSSSWGVSVAPITATADDSLGKAGFVEHTNNQNDSFIPFSSFVGHQ